MDLEKIIELAKEIARPYKITTYILAILLVLSICGNIYLATDTNYITIEAADNTSSNVTQSNKG